MDSEDSASDIIEITTSASEKAQAVLNTISRLENAPQELSSSRNHLLQTRSVLRTLATKLNGDSESSEEIPSFFQEVKLQDSIGTLRKICQEFESSINEQVATPPPAASPPWLATSASPSEKSINKFNIELDAGCKAYTQVLMSINLLLSSQTNGDHLQEQWKALVRDMSFTIEHIARGEKILKTSNQESKILSQLQELCKRTTSAASKYPDAKQKFGILKLDKSYGMQGIVGDCQRGYDQTFNDIYATEHSRAFQGQIDPASFAHMFTKQHPNQRRHS